jgi:uncharacterized protein YecT (DUF1311 family)
MSRLSRIFLLATMATGALIFAAHAAGSGLARTKPADGFARCLDSGDARMGVMPAIFDCYRDELARKDTLLNDTYGSVRKRLAPARQQQLRDLERRWIADRDRTCNAEQDKVGGQDGTVAFYGCHIQQTERRIAWLKDFARKAR